jgi:hypothetical protein
MPHRKTFLAVLSNIALLILCSPLPLYAEKTDIVILRNGDKITGEINKLDRSLLEYSTDDMKPYISTGVKSPGSRA